MLEKLKTVLNHERYEVIAAIVCVVLIFYGISCASKVASIIDPDRRVSRDELSAEVERVLADAEQKFISLDRQDEFKVLLFDKVMIWTSTGVFNPMGILPAVFTVLGMGAVTDNVRRRKADKDANKASGANTV